MTALPPGGRPALHAVPPQPVDPGAAVLELRRRAAADPTAPDLDVVIADARVALAIAVDTLTEQGRHLTRLRELVDDIERLTRAHTRAPGATGGLARAVLHLIHPPGPPGPA